MPKVVYYCGALLVFLVIKVAAQIENFPNPIHFPYSPTGNPYVGLFVAIALPIDVPGPPDADLFFSANFESSYGLPENETTLSYPPLIASARKFLYELITAKLNSYGLEGPNCLQRAICEAAEYTTINTGVLGDLLHIVLTPSSSIKENDIDNYVESEDLGRKYGNCKKYKKKCPINIKCKRTRL